MAWMAPGAEAISEFARQSSGAWKNATCVETSALMDAIGEDPAAAVPPAQIGDYLAKMVATWQAYGDGVTDQGASSYVDATRWLRSLGFTVDEDVLPDVPDWWAEMQHGLGVEHCVYLVGVTNAQALPGDEQGVQNHGLAALGIDDNGNIVCGDPDNWRAQANMPDNPIGAFVTYTQQDFINGQISSLTKVHPMGVPQNWTDDGTTITAPNGVLVEHGFAGHIRNNPWEEDDYPLGAEGPVAQLELSNAALGGGNQQLFRRRMLGWNAAHGVIDEWIGVELQATRGALTSAQAQVAALTAQVASLKAQIAATDPKLAAKAAAFDQMEAIAAKVA